MVLEPESPTPPPSTPSSETETMRCGFERAPMIPLSDG